MAIKDSEGPEANSAAQRGMQARARGARGQMAGPWRGQKSRGQTVEREAPVLQSGSGKTLLSPPVTLSALHPESGPEDKQGQNSTEHEQGTRPRHTEHREQVGQWRHCRTENKQSTASRTEC